MSLHTLTAALRRRLQASRLAQTALIMMFWLAGEMLARRGGIPLPGGIIGMALLLAVLLSRRLHPASARRGAEWLLGDMLLFFVPAVLAVVEHRELFGVLGLKVLCVILAGLVAVMGVTALTVGLYDRWRARGHAARP
ncbi:CidA/LrgA family protein [Bordetella petrii]|uniref:CidA/LrgA family protein n=1 Tax=Bordetella petrii TaxID=94624 RepID=UPI001A965861|nr:CidA/LrgA family protein [Bordetella petrii]MBO1112593.1 CidA/LrgA family protein [Bordetella petrii]